MVCYLYGKAPNLWRVTDCWQDYFDANRHWAKFLCVSARHDDSLPILDQMEEQFRVTLTKDHVFQKR